MSFPDSQTRPPKQMELVRDEALQGLQQALRVLLKKCPTIPVAAIRWIQVQYPVYPEQDELLDSTRSVGVLRHFAGLFYQTSRTFKHSILLALRLLHYRWHYRASLRRLTGETIDVILKSWDFPNRRQGGDEDFYLGDLQSRIESRGVQSLLLVGDSANTSFSEFASANVKVTAQWRLPELLLLKPHIPVLVLACQVASAFRLHLLWLFESDCFLRRVYQKAALHVMSPRTARNAAYYWIGRAAGKQWSPKGLVTLYEGRSWERCLWTGVKRTRPTCTIAGYQHAIILPTSLCLLEPEVDSELVMPDVVACRGEVTRDLLGKGHRAVGIETTALGSFQDDAESDRSGPRPNARCVLVMPVGFVEESIELFDFATEVARQLPDHRFVFRCHPIVSFGRIRSRLARPDLGENIEVSARLTLEEEINRASVTMYRGTSAVFEAASAGHKPVYCGGPGSRNEDPLFEEQAWCERATSVDEAAGILRMYALSTPDEAFGRWESAASYLGRYTQPVTESAVDLLIHELIRREEEGT